MMRRNFARDRQSQLLGATNCVERPGRRDMRDMNRGAGKFCQHAIANHVHVLGRGGHSAQSQDERPAPFVHHPASAQGNVLAVVHHGQSQTRAHIPSLAA